MGETAGGGEVEIVELEHESDEEDDRPRKRPRKATATKPSRSARSTRTGRSTFSDTDMWSVMEAGFWVAADRPGGQFQDRAWINSQSYETLSMMKKVI